MVQATAKRAPTEFIDEICLRVSGGETLTAVCKDLKDFGAPSPTLFRNWVTLDEPPGIAAKYARAREGQWEHWGDAIIDDSEKCRLGEVTETDASGNIIKIKTGDAIERSRLAIDAKKWLLSKLLPKKYGDRVQVDGNQTVTHEVGDSVRTMMSRLRSGGTVADAIEVERVLPRLPREQSGGGIGV